MTPVSENAIGVRNLLTTVPDTRRAADLFSRILRAVREQTAENERKNGGDAA